MSKNWKNPKAVLCVSKGKRNGILRKTSTRVAKSFFFSVPWNRFKINSWREGIFILGKVEKVGKLFVLLFFLFVRGMASEWESRFFY